VSLPEHRIAEELQVGSYVKGGFENHLRRAVCAGRLLSRTSWFCAGRKVRT
jgi:hypothetical protein